MRERVNTVKCLKPLIRVKIFINSSKIKHSYSIYNCNLRQIVQRMLKRVLLEQMTQPITALIFLQANQCQGCFIWHLICSYKGDSFYEYLLFLSAVKWYLNKLATWHFNKTANMSKICLWMYKLFIKVKITYKKIETKQLFPGAYTNLSATGSELQKPLLLMSRFKTVILKLILTLIFIWE